MHLIKLAYLVGFFSTGYGGILYPFIVVTDYCFVGDALLLVYLSVLVDVFLSALKGAYK